MRREIYSERLPKFIRRAYPAAPADGLFRAPGRPAFQQGAVQRFLFGQALFQQKDVSGGGVVHKPAFYQAYSTTTR